MSERSRRKLGKGYLAHRGRVPRDAGEPADVDDAFDILVGLAARVQACLVTLLPTQNQTTTTKCQKKKGKGGGGK